MCHEHSGWGGGRGRRSGPHFGEACDGRELKVKLFEMLLRFIEMEMGRSLMAASGIHSERHSIGVDQIVCERYRSRGTRPDNDAVASMMGPGPGSPGPLPLHIAAENTHSTHAPILHLHYFSIFHSAWVCRQPRRVQRSNYEAVCTD